MAERTERASIPDPAAASSEPAQGGGAAARPRRRTVELLLAGLLAVFTLTSAVDLLPRLVGVDYYLYWVAGQAWERGEIGDLYAPAEEARVGRLFLERAQRQAGGRPTRRLAAAQVRERLDNFSTPFLYTVYGVTSGGAYERDFERTQIASIALFLLGIGCVGWALGYSLTALALLAAVFTLFFSPFVDDTSVGNVNRVQVGQLGLAIGCLALRRLPGRHFAAGLCLGLALMFKPNVAYALVALLFLWAISRRWQELLRVSLGLAAGSALALAASAAYFGSLLPWTRWWPKLNELMPVWASELGNHSLARVLVDRAGADVAAVLPPLMLGLVAACFAIGRFASRRGSRAQVREHAILEQDALAIGLGATASVLATRLAWQHYYLLCIPLGLYLLRPAQTAVARILALFAVALLSVDLFRKVLPAASFDPGLCAVLGSSALFVLGLYEAARRTRAGPDDATLAGPQAP